MDDVQELIAEARGTHVGGTVRSLSHRMADALEALNRENENLSVRFRNQMDAATELIRQLDRAEVEVVRLNAQHEAAVVTLDQYSGWWDGSPEDSWRLERDMRAALGMPEYSEGEDNW